MGRGNTTVKTTVHDRATLRVTWVPRLRAGEQRRLGTFLLDDLDDAEREITALRLVTEGPPKADAP